MSRIRANEITNQNANGAPNFPNGITVTGVVTATTITQNINGDLTVSGNVGVGGTLTYEDVTNVDSVGIITARSTVSIADSIVHIGDTNTSLRFPAADTITAETSGLERLRVTSTGSVGIGTNNPDVGNTSYPVVQVHSTSTNAYFKLTNTTTGVGSGDGVELSLSGSDAYLTNRESADIIFRTGGSNERLRILSSGYVTGNVNVPAWFGSQDTQHNITHSTWTTLINLGNNVVNPSMNNGGWDESTGVFTVQAGQAGVYICYAGGGIDDIQDSDIVRIGISKNDVDPNIYAEQRCIDQGANVVVPSGTMQQLFTVAVGDTLRAKIMHNEGSTEPTEPNRCFFGGYRIAT